MARAPRLHFAGALYHVLARGNQRQSIFRDSEDYQKYQERLAHYQTRFGFLLHAYVLMPNHIHLLIETGSVPLSRVMQGIQLTTTQSFNKKYKTVGHLFQGRYKAILCERESYLLELARYIHLNPVRARLVRRIEDYRWSSYPVYLGLRKEPMVYTDFVLAQFDQHPSRARKGFERFVRDGLQQGHREDFYQLKAQRFLGSDEFVERIPTRSEEGEKFYHVSLDEIVGAVCQRWDLREGDLSQSHRGRREAEARHVIGYLGKRIAGLTYGKVGKRFAREAISFSIGVRRMEEKMGRDPGFRKEIQSLMGILKKGKKIKY